LRRSLVNRNYRLEQCECLEDIHAVSTLTGDRREFAGTPIQVSDVDEASTLLHGLSTPEDQDDLVAVRRIASAHVLHLGDEEQPTISSVYDSILQNWIASLPSDVSLRIRQRKERLARRVAAEVMLSITRIQQRKSQAQVTAPEPSLSQDSGIAMPVLSSQPVATNSTDPTSWMSSQPLPTPSSSQSESSSQSSVPSISTTDPLARLRKHLKFRDDTVAEPQTAMPPNVSQLLSHWQPGVDPQTYDWEAIERADRAEHLDEGSQKRAEKARKRKERRERNQQRENDLARAQPSSQPFTFPQATFHPSAIAPPSSRLFTFSKPAAYPRSSPGPMLGGIASSSQVPGQLFTQVPLPGTGSQSQGAPGTFAAQSQVEPGRFGGRPDKKKKKKGRVSGF